MTSFGFWKYMQQSSKKHKEKIHDRREKVAYLIRTKTEIEIAKILHVSRATIVRDVSFLKKSAQVWLDDLARNDFIFEYKLSVERARERIGKLTELLNKTDDAHKTVEISRELREQEKFYMELLGGAPTVHAFRKATSDGNVQTA